MRYLLDQINLNKVVKVVKKSMISLKTTNFAGMVIYFLEIRLVYVPDNLLEYLECVICRGYLNCFPVYIQSNGQNVCHRCIYANGNPPNCRRNHAYENFSQIFLFPCTYRNRGELQNNIADKI